MFKKKDKTRKTGSEASHPKPTVSGSKVETPASESKIAKQKNVKNNKKRKDKPYKEPAKMKQSPSKAIDAVELTVLKPPPKPPKKELKKTPSEPIKELFKVPIEDFEKKTSEDNIKGKELLESMKNYPLNKKKEKKVKPKKKKLEPITMDRFTWAKKILLMGGEVIFPGLVTIQENLETMTQTEEFKEWMPNKDSTQRDRSSVFATITNQGNRIFFWLWTILYLFNFDITLETLTYIHKSVLIFSLVLFECLSFIRIRASKSGNENDDLVDLNTALAFTVFSMIPLVFIILTDIYIPGSIYFNAIISSILLFLMTVDSIALACQVSSLMGDTGKILMIAQRSWKSVQDSQRNAELKSKMFNIASRSRFQESDPNDAEKIEDASKDKEGSKEEEDASKDKDEEGSKKDASKDKGNKGSKKENASKDKDKDKGNEGSKEDEGSSEDDADKSSIWNNLPFPFQNTESETSSEVSSSKKTNSRLPKYNSVQPVTDQPDSQHSIIEIFKTADTLMTKTKRKVNTRKWEEDEEIEMLSQGIMAPSPVNSKHRSKIVKFEDQIKKRKDKEQPSTSGKSKDNEDPSRTPEKRKTKAEPSTPEKRKSKAEPSTPEKRKGKKVPSTPEKRKLKKEPSTPEKRKFQEEPSTSEAAFRTPEKRKDKKEPPTPEKREFKEEPSTSEAAFRTPEKRKDKVEPSTPSKLKVKEQPPTPKKHKTKKEQSTPKKRKDKKDPSTPEKSKDKKGSFFSRLLSGSGKKK